MQPDGRAGLTADLSGSEEMIQVGVGVHQSDDFQPELLNRCHDFVGVAAGVEYVTQAGISISQHGAIALQWANGEGFAHKAHGGFISCERELRLFKCL